MSDLQNTVFAAVRARGYATGEYLHELRQQILKAQEELGECARYVFDGRAIPASELADAVIPLLVAAALQGDDLEDAIRRKVAADVERGVRNE